MKMDFFLFFIAGLVINVISNLESFYSHVKIKSIYGGIIGFIYLMLTGLIFADIISAAENRFWLIFFLALGGGVGNYIIGVILNKKEKLKSKKLPYYKRVLRKEKIKGF